MFGLLIRQVYRYAPKLSATVSMAFVRAVEVDTFDIQIDLDISAKGGDIHLKELTLSHSVPVFDPDNGVSKCSMSRLLKKLGYCALDGEKQEFPGKLTELQCQSIDVIGMKLSNKECQLFSIVDRICLGRSSDGCWNWPKEGWTLSIRTSAGQFSVPFTFSVHEANDVNAFCRDYGSSGTTVWSC